MNPHIELVKRWLDDSDDSVSQQALRDNAKAAYAADRASAYAAYAAEDAAYDGAYVAAQAEDAAFWVKRYEELTNDK